MEIFKLFGSIFVDTDAADKSIQKTEKKAEGFASKLGNGIKTAAKWGTAIVAGAGAAGAALVGVASNSASVADTIDKMSQKIGISRQAYQELDFICSQSGTSVEKLQSGMKSLTAAMDGARSGTASNVEQFERLGIAVTNADGTFRSQEDVLFDTIGALQSMDDQTEKARLATELFGRAGTELMPLLNGASGSIEEMRKQAHDLGLVLSDEIIDNGVNLTDSLDQTKRALASIGTQLGASLMPIVEKASDYIQQSMPAILSLVQRLAPIVTDLLDGILPPLMDLAEAIFPVLLELLEKLIPPITELLHAILPVLVEVIQMLLPPIMELVEMLLPILVELIQMLLPPIIKIVEAVLPILQKLLSALLPLLQPLINLLTELLEPLIELLDIILPPLIEILALIIQVITDVLQPVIIMLAEVITGILNVAFKSIFVVVQAVIEAVIAVWQTAKNTLENIFHKIQEAISKAWESIKAVTETVFSAIKDFLSAIWDRIKAVVETAVDIVKTVISMAWETVKKVTETAFNAVSKTVSAIWNGIKKVIETVTGAIKSVVTTAWNAIADTVGRVIGGIKDAISNGLNAAKNIVSNILNGIKNKFQSIFDGAKNIVSGAIEKIKSFFRFEWSLPKIKLPHFKISGGFSLNPPSIPSFGVEWYKKGGIMMEPTKFGVNPGTGKDMVGGEAGPEAIAPIEILKEYIREAVSDRDDSVYAVLEAMLELLQEFLPRIPRMRVVLDSGALVGELADPMNEKLGEIIYKRRRQN